MGKLTALVSSATAILFVVPAAALGDGNAETLTKALANTVKAIEVLAGLSVQIEEGDPQAVAALREATEPAIPDGPQRDELLANLRGQLALMQTELDALEGRVAAGAELPWNAAGAPRLPTRAELAAVADPGVTRGLDGATRALIGRIGFAPLRGGAPSSAITGAPLPATNPAAEADYEGYSADPLRQAQAAYRARDYARAIALLEPLGKAPAALYWLARSHEKLGRLDRAEALYREVVAIGGSGSEAARARTDLEFLGWTRRFNSDLATKPAPGTEPAADAEGTQKP